MAFLTNIPRSTLSEWLSDKRELSTRHMRCVRDFLGWTMLKTLQRYAAIYLLKRERTMKIELTEEEVKRLISLLKGIYDRSTDLYELSVIKKILQKLGNDVNDWTPDYADLWLDKFGNRDMMQERKVNIRDLIWKSFAAFNFWKCTIALLIFGCFFIAQN